MTTAPPDPRPALVIGCGYLGRRVADAWLARGRRVVALTRTRAADLAAAGIEPVVGDVLDPASLTGLPDASTVLYAVGLDRSAGRSNPTARGTGSTREPSMRDVYVGGLANVLDVLGRNRAFPRFLYVSSTGIYGQTDGSVVTEDSPTEPTEESGKVVLAAETLLRARVPDAVVLRFAGIYGPGRVLRRQALLAGEPLVGDAEKWLNLIHVADGVAAVLAAEERANSGGTYLIADGTPVRRREFYTHAAEVLGGPPARFTPHPPGAPLPPEPNRRIDNGKARRELRFAPRFPSFREGTADAVGEG